MNLKSTLRTLARNPVGVVRDARRARQLASAHPEVAETIDRVRRERLTYLRPVHLWGLAGALLELDAQGIDGAIVETGAALGGSSILLATVRQRARPVYVYDAFGMIPPPSERDGADVHERYEQIRSGQSKGLGGDTYYGYRDDLLGDVTRSFERYGIDTRTADVTLVPGFFEETLHLDEPVALAHVDCDWYDSVRVSLERIVPHLVTGGRVVVDDYWTYSGCRDAVDDFTREHPELQPERRARLHLVKR